MITITRQPAGMYGLGSMHRAPAYPPAAQRVMAAQRASGNWMQVQRLNGLNGTVIPTVDDSIVFGVGGVLLGLAAGYALYGMKKKR